MPIDSPIVSFEDWAKSLDNVDDSFVKFCKDLDSGDVTIDNIDESMKKAGISTNKFSSSLANIAANIGIMLAINVAIQVATKLWDEFNTTVEEAQSDLDETQSVIADLETQIKELESIDANALTQGQKDKLENLKEQLEVQKQLEEIEKRRVAQEKLGTGNWSDQFDEGSYAKAKKEMEKAKSDYEVDARDFAPYQQVVENLKYWSDLYEKEKNESGSTDYGLDTIEYQLEKSRQSVELYTEDIGGMYNSLLSQKADIQEWSTFLQDGIENGLFVGEDLEYANTELERLSVELTWVEEQMKYINELLYGGDDSIENTIAEKTKYSYQNLIDNEFSEEDLQLLATLTFDKNASIAELREILAEAKKTTDDFANESEILSLEELTKQLDTIQSAYNTVASAIEEYNAQGYLSVDTYQSLMELSPEYLQYLMDEEGNLRLGTEAMNEYTYALIDNMAKKQMQSIVDYVGNLSAEERQLYLTKQATDEASESLLDFASATISAKFAAGELSKEELESLKSMLSGVASWAESAKEGIGKGGLRTGSSSSTTDFKDILDKYLNLYEAELNAGIISFNDFLSKSRSMLDQYYREGKISAADYWGYVGSLYEKQLKGYDRVINAVTSLIDDEIEKLEEQKTAIEESYELRISKIQEEIDALQEANDERQKQYELEKARYELERAMNQRTKKVLTDEHGFIYTTDNETIREAQNDLAEKENELKISKLESQIDALEKEMKSATQTIEEQIDRLNKYKDSWNDVADEYEKAQDRMYAANILGADYESQILAMRTDVLNNFASNYIATQQAIVDAAWQSANEQNKALASIGTGSINGSGTVGNTSTTSANYRIVDTATGKVIVDGLSLSEANAYFDKMTEKLQQRRTIEKYASGTKNAKPGVHEVSENGDEIIIDNHGNAILAQGHQLHAFEGGETVIKSSETIELLKNQGRLVPVQTWFDSLDTSKFMENMPNITPNIHVPNYDFAKMNHNTGTTISIGDIHLHEVQNVDSFADAIIREFPNVVTQKIHK